MTDHKVRVFRPGEGTANTAQTAGMQREELVSTPSAWVGMVQTAPGFTSGWHHHGDRDTFGYVVRGRVGFDFGPGGHDHVDVEQGGFFCVPAGLVHREVNVEPSEVVLVFVGDGPVVVNLDAPAPA